MYATMYRKLALIVLVSALSVASVILTHTLFAFVKNVQFGTNVMTKEYSHFPLIPPEPQWARLTSGEKVCRGVLLKLQKMFTNFGSEVRDG